MNFIANLRAELERNNCREAEKTIEILRRQWGGSQVYIPQKMPRDPPRSHETVRDLMARGYSRSAAYSALNRKKSR